MSCVEELADSEDIEGAGAFLAVFVYTPEVYPTKIRALGLATSSSLGRIGGMVSPYIAQV